MNLTEQFADLFAGREDAYGTDAGGAVRYERGIGTDAYRDHLYGINPIGVYPMVPTPVDTEAFKHMPTYVIQHQVKWGCVDLDVKREGKTRYDYDTTQEAHVGARNLRGALSLLGIPAYIERTRSDGRHVWVFAADWVLAATMRRALLVACEMAHVPPTEVNPKQETLAENQLGNYVRVCYPGWLGQDHSYERQVMVDAEGCYISLTNFLGQVQYADYGPLLEASKLYAPPPAPEPLCFDNIESIGVIKKLSGLAYTIMNDGPLEGGDRSGTLYKLACLCHEDGLTPAEALVVVKTADAKWGKYHQRADGEKYMKRTIEKAYADD